MLWWLAIGCGGPSDLAKPADPPAWPLENLHVKRQGAVPVGDPVPAVPAPAGGPAVPSAPAPTGAPTDTDAAQEAP